MIDTPEQPRPWWQRGVVYQVYPRSFQDSDGDGVGDLRGIVRRLDYLRWLGVDAIWLSPIFPSPMRDFGYDVTDATDVDPLFGDLNDFDALVDEAHRRDLRLVLDVVPNHTSDEHPWFARSRSSKDDPRRDWYIWRDAKPDGSPPTNWRGVDALDTPGSLWRFDARTDQYYLASFSAFQPDLNWANPEVREAMNDVLRFWLDRGVDGFRLDMADFLGKDPHFRDEPPDTAAADDYLAATRFQLYAPATRAHLAELGRTVHARPGRVLIGEVLYQLSPDQLAAYYRGAPPAASDAVDDEVAPDEVAPGEVAPGEVAHGEVAHDKGLDMPFHFGLMFVPMRAGPLRARIDAYEAAIGDRWPNYNLANHDMPRLRRHGDATRLAVMLLLTLRGTPFLYYGDEIGMANVDVPPERQLDPFIIYLTGTTRDGVRTPMQWSAERHAGFSDAEPWLPVAPDADTVNVEAERSDPRSMLSLHRRLLSLRAARPALHSGGYEPLDGTPEGVFAYRRQHRSDGALVALNFTDAVQEMELPRSERWSLALSTALDDAARPADGTVVLRPHEGIVLVRDGATGDGPDTRA